MLGDNLMLPTAGRFNNSGGAVENSNNYPTTEYWTSSEIPRNRNGYIFGVVHNNDSQERSTIDGTPVRCIKNN